ncbi:MAG: hypothetical protein ACTSUC_12110 [Promethearchaeota archaeon]
MIDKTKVSRKIQYNDTCILFNYAIAGNYFTRKHIIDYFIDYMKYFESDFKSSKEDQILRIYHSIEQSNFDRDLAERYLSFKSNGYAKFFHQHLKVTCRNKFANIPGLKLISKLHNNSDKPSFVESRKKFRDKFFIINGADRYGLQKLINEKLKQQVAIVNIYVDELEKEGVHSISGKNFKFQCNHSHTVFCDSNAFYLCNTNNNELFSIPQNWLYIIKRGNLLVYTQK